VGAVFGSLETTGVLVRAALLTMNTVRPCPSEESLVRYATDELHGSARNALARHLHICETCDVAVALCRGTHQSSIHFTETPEEKAVLRRVHFARALQPGQLLGHFRIVERIGMGAMGVVFAALDTRLERHVALKVLLESRQSLERAHAQLQLEARSMARLVHPNVVTLFEIGSDRDCVFMAMELVTGYSLREWLQKRPDTKQVMHLFSNIALAVQAAHDAGIIHRDLKPQNILVSKSGEPKVTDFGLAQSMESLDGSQSGTPAYMPLEALDGRGAGPASDQFSLAVCLHEALTGNRPFARATMEEYRLALRERPAVDSSLPRHIRNALARALHVDPEQRFDSVQAFAKALSTGARSTSSWRVRTWVAVVGAVTLAGAGAAALRSRHSRVEQEPSSVQHVSATAESPEPTLPMGTLQASTSAVPSAPEVVTSKPLTRVPTSNGFVIPRASASPTKRSDDDELTRSRR
jgi:eukaryotic-like serine/threonine-protein kinase